MNICIKPSPEETAVAVALDISQFIRKNPGALLCFAAGDTPLPVFRILIDMQARGDVDLGSVFYVGLDEWVGLGRETKGSCAQVMYDSFYTPARIPESKICAWDGLKDPLYEMKRVEAWISSHGGIALALLGIGMNGHIGFNEPYSKLTTGTGLVQLDETTKQVSVKYFSTPQPVKEGVTICMGELKKAKKLIMMATGQHKASIIKKVAQCQPDEVVPASLMTNHPNIALYIDRWAGELLL